MTVKAYSSIASHLVVEMNVSILAPTTYLCAQLLQPCYEKHDVEAFLLLIHTFGDLLSSNLLPVDLIASISWVSISVSSLPPFPIDFRQHKRPLSAAHRLQLLPHQGARPTLAAP